MTVLVCHRFTPGLQEPPYPAICHLGSHHKQLACALAALKATAAVPCDQLASKNWTTADLLKIDSAKLLAATATVSEHRDVRGAFFPEAHFAIKLPPFGTSFPNGRGGGFTSILRFPAVDAAWRGRRTRWSCDSAGFVIGVDNALQ